MFIGKIVKSDSHINYVCQIYGHREVEVEPGPADYAFGRFVRIGLRSEQPEDPHSDLNFALGISHEPKTYAVGVIYDTILLNPAFGSLGPRLSNETQVELFSPDYISEKAVLIYVMVLGILEQRVHPGGQAEFFSTMHGVPLLSLELGSEIETMTDAEVRAFHFFSDQPEPGKRAYLHMGYLPHIIAQRNSLLPMVTLRIIDPNARARTRFRPVGITKGPGETTHEYTFVSRDDEQVLKNGEYVYYELSESGDDGLSETWEPSQRAFSRRVLGRIIKRVPLQLYPDTFLAEPEISPTEVAAMVGYDARANELF